MASASRTRKAATSPLVCGVEDHGDSRRPARPAAQALAYQSQRGCQRRDRRLRDALGFTLTDTTKRLRFFSCNSDHHSVVVGFSGGPTLNHLAFEMLDLDATMRGAGRMRDAGHGIEWGPGRHGAGNNVFCYFLGPEDFPIEYTSEMQQIKLGYCAGNHPGLDMAAGPARSVGHQRAHRVSAWKPPASMCISPTTAGGWTPGADRIVKGRGRVR